MCDYSLTAVKSRAANVADQLTTKNFGFGTTGFAASEDASTAVCVLPGTELAFDAPIEKISYSFLVDLIHDAIHGQHTTARFRQINKDEEKTHHDALELPDGQIVMLTHLAEGQTATVLQLPATPKTPEEAEAQRRVVVNEAVLPAVEFLS